MKVRKSIYIGVLSLGMLLGLATVSMADEMNGMNMGGNSMQSDQHSATSGMDPNMPGMNMNSNPAPNDQHKATSGMDPNMPGMNGSEKQSDGHNESETSEGVNWPVVGGFSAINLLVIVAAGILKAKAK